MDDAHRAEFGALLRERRASVDETLAALAADLAALASARTDTTADDEHDPEGVTLSGEWSRLEGLRVAQERDRDALDAALARWDAGDYGICQGCGRPIPVGRLRVRPMATLCVTCAERAGG
ncbi:TraR/DksA family transcriptional regulator [Microbacterium elymi]|uniref:TraR/DksA family transcriptional regulator n=1 Tax=Microbacterium elymi TaxID=2909587 RepID=A0ABY5NJB4_9MICO|nr:TraR/DksA family transcriptional regulator [Microbacterium elymi]UUT35219.1 TraR/DksA family transcriptional regulator [Microbacterium elymi]